MTGKNFQIRVDDRPATDYFLIPHTFFECLNPKVL